MTNSDYKRNAIEALRGKWGVSALVTLIYLIIYVVSSRLPGVGRFAIILFSFPIYYGLEYIFLGVYRGRKPEVDQLFHGFTDFTRVFVTGILMYIYVILWSLLLIVPGIIAGISYTMTYFILMDDPNIKAEDAIKQSKEMMNGHKARFFYLMISFIGWSLLNVLTLGIGTLWLNSYILTTKAAFYEDLKIRNDMGANL